MTMWERELRSALREMVRYRHLRTQMATVWFWTANGKACALLAISDGDHARYSQIRHKLAMGAHKRMDRIWEELASARGHAEARAIVDEIRNALNTELST